jgi:hypothetical protein
MMHMQRVDKLYLFYKQETALQSGTHYQRALQILFLFASWTIKYYTITVFW